VSIYNKLQILHTKEIFTEGSWIFSRITASAWNLNSLVMSWDRWLCREKFRKRSVLFKLQAAYPCLGIIRSNWSLKILRSTDKCTPWKASSHFREREEYEFKNHEGVGRRTLRAVQFHSVQATCSSWSASWLSNGSISFNRRLHALMKMVTWL